jgi:hypothetical protein
MKIFWIETIATVSQVVLLGIGLPTINFIVGKQVLKGTIGICGFVFSIQLQVLFASRFHHYQSYHTQ